MTKKIIISAVAVGVAIVIFVGVLLFINHQAPQKPKSLENVSQPDVLFAPVHASIYYWGDVKEMMSSSNSNLVFIGTIKDISFSVGINKQASMPSPSISTKFDVDVKEVFRGEYREQYVVGVIGGMSNYKQDEQKAEWAKAVEEARKYNDFSEDVTWPLEYSPAVQSISIGQEYLFIAYDHGAKELVSLQGGGEQTYFDLRDPLAKNSGGFSVKDILTELGAWDDYWVQWQKDHPDWEPAQPAE